MTLQNNLARIQRELAFARHMPTAKLARRFELMIKRRVRDRLRLPLRTTGETPIARQCPPEPIFSPRRGMIRDGNAFQFTLLGREIEANPTRIDWNSPGRGAENQLWRMNLHYMEYLEAVDDARFSSLVEQWIATNPSHARGAWRDSWNSYSLSLRGLVWMQQLARRKGSLSPALCARMHESLYEQFQFLEHNLETDLGGNHLIKNIKALLWASAYFSGPVAERWRKTGLELLQKELSSQILADGMHYERSPSYHCQVFADLLEIRHALAGNPLEGVLDDALERMAQATADLTHPNGDVALFNDSGLSMAYAPGDCLDQYQRMFGKRPERRPVFSLPDAGYFGLNTARVYFVADCGRIAPDDLPAHGHGDIFSFEWSVGGHRIVVDQGVFEYVAGEKRQKSRSTSSHNTLSLEGVDQADFFGAFRCGRRPSVQLRVWESRTDGLLLEGGHNGFAHLPGGPVHIRRFEVDPHGIEIFDKLEGQTDRRVSISFLLHPDVYVRRAATGLLLKRGNIQVTMTSTCQLTWEKAVWWPDMGREVSTRRVVATLNDCRHAHTKLAILTSTQGTF